MTQSDVRVDSSVQLNSSRSDVPVLPRSGGRFSDRVVEPDPPRGNRARGFFSVSAAVAQRAGPVGGLVSAGLSLLGQGGEGQAARGDEQMERMWAMQQESRAHNLEYLALQDAMQSENRRFSVLSNLMKARHDTAKSAISNIRV